MDLQQLEIELDQRIANPEFRDLADIREWFIAVEIEGIEDLYSFTHKSYNRLSLISSDAYDLVLCCWKPGQDSPFHGHPKQGCLVKILEGTTTEEIKFADGRNVIQDNSKGAHCYINDQIGIHRVWNRMKQNAVSLHLYAPGGYEPAYK